MPSFEPNPTLPSSSSSSFENATGTNMTIGDHLSDATFSQQKSVTTPPPKHITRKRKRRNSTMIIKPARWSPPLHHHHPSNALIPSAPIETDFQPTFYNPNEIKHRRRISSQQYGILEDEYLINTKPNASKRHHLAELLGMTPRTVQIWFQNKRAKSKHQQGKPHHAEKKSLSTLATTSLAETSEKWSPFRSSSTTTVVSGHLDQLSFDDGRLDPIYLMDDHDITAFMAASSSPSSSSTTSAITSTQQITNQDASNDEVNSTTAGTVFVDDHSGQHPSMLDDHGTTATAPTSSSSPLLPSSDIYDSFTMGPQHLASTNHRQHQCCDETFSASTASSSPSQQFSPVDLSFTYYHYHDTQHRDTAFLATDASLYSPLKENYNDQEELLRSDALYILNWMQKTPTDLPIGEPMVPSWPYAMDQPVLQTDCLNFGLGHVDWVDPFSVSA